MTDMLARMGSFSTQALQEANGDEEVVAAI
jgi:hypothetical protein